MVNYMTNVNKTYGNFAIQDNEMFMTLNRRYGMIIEEVIFQEVINNSETQGDGNTQVLGSKPTTRRR